MAVSTVPSGGDRLRRGPPLGHQPGEIGREFAEQGARDMHAAGIGESFQRPGDAEAAVDREFGGLLARDFDNSRGEGARRAASVDAASFDGAGPRRLVEDETGLAAEHRNRRAELHAHRAAPQPVALVGRQRGAGNARGDQGRVAQQRPDLVGRQRNRRGLAQCHHGYAASRRWISSCMMVVRQWMRGSSGGWPPQALCRPQRLSQITMSPTRHLCWYCAGVAIM